MTHMEKRHGIPTRDACFAALATPCDAPVPVLPASTFP